MILKNCPNQAGFVITIFIPKACNRPDTKIFEAYDFFVCKKHRESWERICKEMEWEYGVTPISVTRKCDW